MGLDPIYASKLLNDRIIDDETLSNFFLKMHQLEKQREE
jgi:hypothetical protein